MRFIAEKWFLGPIVASFALYACWLGGEIHAKARAQEILQSRIDRLYSLAQSRDYDSISRLGLATPEAIDYLRTQESLFGRIREWEASPASWCSLENSSIQVNVTRDRLTEWETAAFENRDPFAISGPAVSETYDANGWSSPVATPEQAMTVARHVIHQTASGSVHRPSARQV